ncbi:phosphate ABC transporter substrate-binding protein PstS family protein [Streptomyces sp. ACA25]|uniref:PstS family phosphate ABC transporter substrate-binding protein n=1 Tax=Streptomyces sp. ACA25 TaxID=3022596 RepID=UPI00230705C3|nr:phosphate ABC transporter substrate-binding protein PstS family protein [Streptomyces sp. ACA25]MDB1088088.1 phosphate ABC transporter substrate-binding protein PstS family protein [Streptomyces sp. ACA25]
MRNWRTKTAAIVAVSALALTTACGSDDSNADESGSGTGTGSSTGDGDGNLSGTIRADGSSTVGPLAEVAAEMFMEANPEVRVDVAISGTSGGFEKFCLGENDMNNASRAIKDSEIELCEANGIAYDNIQVSNDALSLVVNNESPLECLSVEQANQIWDEGSAVSNWGDVDGLDLPDDFASEEITLYGPGTDSGTFDFFTEAINGEEGRIRTDYTDIGEDDHAAVVGVEGDWAAMGYIPYSYIQAAGDSIKALQIDGGEGCVDGTLENVQDGSYSPLGRPLYTYASDKALEQDATVEFLTFWLENSAQIAETATFVPMTQEQIDEGHAKVESLTSGS